MTDAAYNAVLNATFHNRLDCDLALFKTTVDDLPALREILTTATGDWRRVAIRRRIAELEGNP